MPVTIGAKPESDFRNPIGMLSDCHRRIDHFLAVLIAIAEETNGAVIAPGRRQQFEIALRYFREAAPKHTLDEEESLFPRLLKHRRPNVPDPLVELDHLEAEHIRASNRHRLVDKLGLEWLTKGGLSTSDSEILLANLRKLRANYEEHIAFEEEQIFPRALSVLSDEDLRLIGEEMAARRGL